MHLADLVEQERAAVRLLELADAARHGTGKCPFLVAEQLGFEKIVRNRGAIQRHQTLLAAAAVPMQIARQHLLAGAALAGDQHAGVRGRDLARHGQQLPHPDVLGHQLVGGVDQPGGDGVDEAGLCRQRQEALGASIVDDRRTRLGHGRRGGTRRSDGPVPRKVRCGIDQDQLDPRQDLQRDPCLRQAGHPMNDEARHVQQAGSPERGGACGDDQDLHRSTAMMPRRHPGRAVARQPQRLPRCRAS